MILSSEKNIVDLGQLFLVLDVAKERECEGDLLLGDMGDGLPFRPGTFDGIIRYVTLTYEYIYCNNTSFILHPKQAYRG